MSGLVTDLPIWGDFPARDQVSKNIEIRRGMMFDRDTIAFWNPMTQRHVDVYADHHPGIDDPDFDWSRILNEALLWAS